MKHKLLIVALAIMAVFSIAIAADQEKPWYDMKNCEFCKPWITPEMTKNCTWDQVETANGVLTVGLFPETFRPKYRAAYDQTQALSMKAAAGEKVHMCGSCETMGSFFMKGVKMEELYMKSGVAMLMTSNDSTLVSDMHAWAKRNAEEEKKMKAVEKK